MMPATAEMAGTGAELAALVPRDLRANLILRHGLASRPEDERVALAVMMRDGADGCLAWINLCVWTFDPRLDPPHRPLILWPVQEPAVRELWAGIEDGHDVLIEKSRDMGASWLCVAVFAWWLLFGPDVPLLLVSRKEDLVDRRGDPDALFWKLDYLLRHVPSWMQPATERMKLQIINRDNGAVISGDTTTADIGRGGRRRAVLLDEAAAMPDLAAVLSSTADVARCRIFNSTPNPVSGSTFKDLRFPPPGKDGPRVVTLPWWEHPAKGKDRRRIIGEDGKLRWTSPWYAAECRRRISRREIAQELDMDYLLAGAGFFDGDVLSRIQAEDVRPPDHEGEVQFHLRELTAGERYGLEGVLWAEGAGRGRLKLWAEPDDRNRVRQDRNYVAFADISNGSGDSNSVLSVMDVTSGDKVAEFADPYVLPEEFAIICVAICLWIRGQNEWCFLGWEANGPGGIFGRQVRRLGYPYVLTQRQEGRRSERRGERRGWWNDRQSNRNLLADYRRALAAREFINHSELAIREAGAYLELPDGTVGPGTFAEDPSGARANHGDRVRADAGCVLCRREQPRAQVPAGRPPKTSVAALMQRRRAREDRQRRW